MNIEIELTDEELMEAVRDWLSKHGHAGDWTVHLGAKEVSYDRMERDIHYRAKITAEQTKKP